VRRRQQLRRPSTAGTGGSGEPPAESENTFDPASISGDVTLGQWESSPAEGTALKGAIDAFSPPTPTSRSPRRRSRATTAPQMITKFGASDVPDLFYVNAEYAPSG
jgi:hypothetical protein